MKKTFKEFLKETKEVNWTYESAESLKRLLDLIIDEKGSLGDIVALAEEIKEKTLINKLY